MLYQITPDEAVEVLLQQPIALRREDVPIGAGLGRILASNMEAVIPVPPFARSPYDGYALCSADTLQASRDTPVTLKIIAEIPAGSFSEKGVAPGTAAKICTGAPVPSGADCVVKYEETEFDEKAVTIRRPYLPGNIVPAGEDMAAGSVAAARGSVIDSGTLGVLAGQGYATLPVFQKPKVALISTGSELVQVGSPLAAGKIYDTNVYTIGGILAEMGAVPLKSPVIVDDPSAIAAEICRQCKKADMVVMTGGASVGDYDFARAALELAGAETLFQRVRLKPGGAMAVGCLDGKLVLCLSGNPGAAAIGLLRVAAPYIRALCGRTDLYFDKIQVTLRQSLEKASPQWRILRGRLLIENGRASFLEMANQGNGGVSSLVGCGLLAEIPAGTPPLPAGSMVWAYRLSR